MRVTIETQDAPTAQDLYNALTDLISEIEADTYELAPLFILLGLVRAFLESNYEVS